MYFQIAPHDAARLQGASDQRRFTRIMENTEESATPGIPAEPNAEDTNPETEPQETVPNPTLLETEPVPTTEEETGDTEEPEEEEQEEGTEEDES